MTTTGKWITGLIALVIIIALVAVFGRGEDGGEVAEEGPIRIGFVGPLSGDAAAYGEPSSNAAIIAVDEVNAAGGVNGRMLEFLPQDSECTGAKAASAAQKLVQTDKVKYIVGLVCSGDALAIRPITEAEGVIFFSAYATNPEISEGTRYFFRTVPTDALTGRVLAEKLYEQYGSVAVITENTEYAQGLRNIFTTTYKELGGTVSVDEVAPPETKDFRAQITKVLAANPEAVFVNTQAGGSAQAMIKQMRELGLEQKVVAAYWTGPDFVEAGPWVNGTLVADAPQLNEENPLAKSFMEKYLARFGAAPNYAVGAGGAYDSVMLLAEAMRAVGDDTDVVRDYLHALSNYGGTLGAYSFDERGDVVGIDLTFWEVEDNKIVPAAI